MLSRMKFFIYNICNFEARWIFAQDKKLNSRFGWNYLKVTSRVAEIEVEIEVPGLQKMKLNKKKYGIQLNMDHNADETCLNKDCRC